MAGKITELAALTAAVANAADLIEAVDVSDTSMAATGTNKKITLAELLTFIVSADAGNLLSLGTDGKLYISETAFTNFVMSRLVAKIFITNGAAPPVGYTPGSAWIEREV